MTNKKRHANVTVIIATILAVLFFIGTASGLLIAMFFRNSPRIESVTSSNTASSDVKAPPASINNYQEPIHNETPKEAIARKPSPSTTEDEILFRGDSLKYIFLNGEKINMGERVSMKVDMTSKGDSFTFTLGPERQHGTLIGVSGGENYVPENLISEIEQGDFFDEFGYIGGDVAPAEDIFVQMTVVDLDHDGINELVVSIGDMLINLVTNIFRFTNSFDRPFIYVNHLTGQEYMRFHGNGNIIAPFGSQGQYNEYKYERGVVYDYDYDNDGGIKLIPVQRLQ